MTTAARTARYRTQSFRLQYELRRTLWSEDQIEALEKEILYALESEFGRRTIKKPKPLPVQHEVGWFSEPHHNLGGRDLTDVEALPDRIFDGLRICRCRGCSQRISWRPAFGAQVCSDKCFKFVAVSEAQWAENNARRALAREKKEKTARKPSRQSWLASHSAFPKIAILVPDHVELTKIAGSLQQQLAQKHNTQTIFVGAQCVRGEWTVMEFSITNGSGGSLHVILNGSGPGRAAWTLAATSAEQAVSRVIGFGAYSYSPGIGVPHSI
jgi:hypothetical protein